MDDDRREGDLAPIRHGDVRACDQRRRAHRPLRTPEHDVEYARVDRRRLHDGGDAGRRDDIHDAIIAQFLPLVPGSSQLFSYTSNVDHVRSQGMELVLGSNDLFVRGLELQGSATYTGAKTLELSGRASATAPEGAAIGKQLPNIPKRRATFSATYRPDQQRKLALTVAGRYSDKMYTTLDNADVNPNTYQGFSSWFVADTRAN